MFMSSPSCLCLSCIQIDHYAHRDLKRGLQLFGTEGNVGFDQRLDDCTNGFPLLWRDQPYDWLRCITPAACPTPAVWSTATTVASRTLGTWWTAG
ncbi:hypothetical protein J4Q44_G00356150 [Coregonus suidteri]|uniref:Uncharacterized protein n=1 Tax=Coregonus suidteri TaxID=861788 RepID=A0AAN8Q866_9TELE